jgi:hypothetical protein
VPGSSGGTIKRRSFPVVHFAALPFRLFSTLNHCDQIRNLPIPRSNLFQASPSRRSPAMALELPIQPAGLVRFNQMICCHEGDGLTDCFRLSVTVNMGQISGRISQLALTQISQSSSLSSPSIYAPTIWEICLQAGKRPVHHSPSIGVQKYPRAVPVASTSANGSYSPRINSSIFGCVSSIIHGSPESSGLC